MSESGEIFVAVSFVEVSWTTAAAPCKKGSFAPSYPPSRQRKSGKAYGAATKGPRLCAYVIEAVLSVPFSTMPRKCRACGRKQRELRFYGGGNFSGDDGGNWVFYRD